MHRFDVIALARDGGAVFLRALFPLVNADAPIAWVDVAPTGEWLGHPSGPFELTAAKFDAMVTNFERKANPTPLDYEHSSLLQQEAPAAGWVHKLERRADRLWALVEFTAKAASQVKAGEYRFCSAVFVWNAKDPKTGEPIGPAIHSIALTNVPFIDGQQPIALSARGGSMDPEKQLEQIKKALGLEDKAAGDAIVKALQAIIQLAEAQSGKKPAGGDKPAGDAPPPAPAADKPAPKAEEKPATSAASTKTPAAAAAPGAAGADPARAAAGDELLGLLMDSLGTDPAATVAWVRERLDAIKGLGAAAGSPTGASSKPDDAIALSRTLKLADGEVARLTARVEELEAKGTDGAKKGVDERIGAALKDGRILDAEKDDFVWLSQTDPERFDRMLAARRPVVPTKEIAPPPAPGKQPTTRLDLSEAEAHALTTYKASGGTNETKFLERFRTRTKKAAS